MKGLGLLLDAAMITSKICDSSNKGKVRVNTTSCHRVEHSDIYARLITRSFAKLRLCLRICMEDVAEFVGDSRNREDGHQRIVTNHTNT